MDNIINLEFENENLLSEELENRIKKYFNNRKKLLEDFFEIKSSAEINIKIFRSQESFKGYVSKFYNVSSYCTGCVCDGKICSFLNEEMLKDNGKTGYMIATIFHEYVHYYYRNYVKGNRRIWLEEGLATYFSGQKGNLEKDENNFKAFISRLKQKELPNITFLNTKGEKYGCFCDTMTNRYNGYDISYLLIRMLIENDKEELLKIIKDNKELENFENRAFEQLENYIDKQV